MLLYNFIINRLQIVAKDKLQIDPGTLFAYCVDINAFWLPPQSSGSLIFLSWKRRQGI